MSQTAKVSGVATTIRTDTNGTHVRYHSTDVVSFNDKTITLRTGGWNTATTRLRMNQASNQFHLGFSVYQKAGRLYCNDRDNRNDVEFDTTHTIERA